ncbi:LCP family protein [Naumannella sp. ID2617S]|nr:LCP family protein [Naumannella sp. ID2617S]
MSVSQGSAGVARRRHADQDFARPALWTALGTYLPGLGLWRAGRRRLGLGILIGWAVLVLVLAVLALTNRFALLHAVLDPTVLRVVCGLLVLLALGWGVLVVTTHLLLRPGGWDKVRRGLGAALVGVLCLSVTAPLAVAARYAWDQAALLDGVFRRDDQIRSGTAPRLDASNPWKNKPRVNILILGGDAGKDRTGTRTDSIMVASIDTRTGSTTLIGIPRNTARMPFPADSPLHRYFPNGFYDGDADDQEHFANEMYENLPKQVPADVLGPTDNLGADALKLSVGEATGLKIDYYLLVEISGFKALADALGGITVNINTWVAMGGDTDRGIKPSKWLRPGPNQHLDGTETLWFARGRYGADDFQRMDRQRCTVLAIIQQANPATMLTRYEAVAAASKDMVLTDLPREVLPAVVDLSNRVKNAQVRSVAFKHGVDGFSSANPDFAMMRARVGLAIQQSGGTAGAPPSPAAPPSASPTGPGTPQRSATARATASQAPRATSAPSTRRTLQAGGAPGSTTTPVAPSDDLRSSCAYNPTLAAEQLAAGPPR